VLCEEFIVSGLENDGVGSGRKLNPLFDLEGTGRKASTVSKNPAVAASGGGKKKRVVNPMLLLNNSGVDSSAVPVDNSVDDRLVGVDYAPVDNVVDSTVFGDDSGSGSGDDSGVDFGVNVGELGVSSDSGEGDSVPVDEAVKRANLESIFGVKEPVDKPVDFVRDIPLPVKPVKPVREVNPLFTTLGVGSGEGDSDSGKKEGLSPVGDKSGEVKRVVDKRFSLRDDDLFKPKKALVPSVMRPEALFESGEWGEGDKGTSVGLGGDVDDSFVKPDFSKTFRLTDRDIVILKFIARYRYAYVDQVARLVDATPGAVSQRLKKLENVGLVRRESVTDRQYLWTTRKAGNTVVDLDLPEIRKGSISPVTLAHTVGLCNIGAEFEREMGG
jgi:DNA-binding transcriptional ArsR family regulator